MFELNASRVVYLHRDAIDFRKNINGLALPFTHNYFHPDLAVPSTNPAHIICKQA